MGKLRRIREDHGLSQADLARLIGVTERTIYNYENNTTLFNRVARICRALDCSIEDLEDDNQVKGSN